MSVSVCRACSVPHSVGCPECRGFGMRAGLPVALADVYNGTGTERCRVCTADHTGVLPEPVGFVDRCVELPAQDRTPRPAARRVARKG